MKKKYNTLLKECMMHKIDPHQNVGSELSKERLKRQSLHGNCISVYNNPLIGDLVNNHQSGRVDKFTSLQNKVRDNETSIEDLIAIKESIDIESEKFKINDLLNLMKVLKTNDKNKILNFFNSKLKSKISLDEVKKTIQSHDKNFDNSLLNKIETKLYTKINNKVTSKGLALLLYLNNKKNSLKKLDEIIKKAEETEKETMSTSTVILLYFSIFFSIISMNLLVSTAIDIFGFAPGIIIFLIFIISYSIYNEIYYTHN